MSINKDILFRMFERALSEEAHPESDALLYLLHRVIFHNCIDNYIFKGDPAMLDKIPPHKTLFKMPPEKGLPIGNLTSQFFANVYLTALDIFIKHTLKCPFYIRYVDDLILLSQKKEELIAWKEGIEAFVRERLDLTIKATAEIKRLHCGADFLGYIVRPSYILSRKRVVNNLKHKLAQFKERMITPCRFSDISAVRVIMKPEEVSRLRQILSSYLGHFRHADTYRLTLSIFEKNSWLGEYFILHKGRILNRFKHKGAFSSLHVQYIFFKARCEGTILFVRVGSFIEIYNQEAVMLAPLLGLEIKEGVRGMDQAAGFPLRYRRHYLYKTLSLGKDVAFLEEAGKGRFLKERYLREIYRITKDESAASAKQ